MKITILFFILIGSIIDINAQNTTPVNPLEQVGDTVTLSGRIYAGYHLIHVKKKPTFLNVYDSLPNHRLMLRIDSADRAKFTTAPETYYLNKKISITGLVENYKGTALIRVTEPSMIKTDSEEDTSFQRNTVVRNQYTPEVRPGPKADSRTMPDTLLQSTWIKNVAGKSYEQTFNDVWIVQKEIPLRVNPSSDAPVIADLQPGIAISILYTSKRWSYVTVRKPDGTGGVYGFIKKRAYRHLKNEEK